MISADFDHKCGRVTGLLISLFFCAPAFADMITFSGELGYVDVDDGTGVYAGTPLGTLFTGNIDDVTFAGSITDGMTITSFTCCVAAGGLDFTNHEEVTQDAADALNALLGYSEFMQGEFVDLVEIEGDNDVDVAGRIEVGLTYVLFDSAFDDESDPDNYPFDPADLRAALFFILEQDAGGEDIYSAIGLLNPVPLPAAAWLLASGLLGLFATRRARRAVATRRPAAARY